MIVDDVDAAWMLAMLVQELGGEARVAQDDRAGVRLVTEVRPDVVFLDIGMSTMDGYEVCRRLRSFVEALLFPFHAHGKPVGTVWIVSHRPERRFDREDARIVKLLTQYASSAWQLWQQGEQARERAIPSEPSSTPLQCSNSGTANPIRHGAPWT